MNKVKTFLRLLFQNPGQIVVALGRNGILNWVSTQLYIKIIYKLITSRKLNLEKPVTYNEKLQWFKCFWYDKSVVQCVDKYDVRSYIKQKGLEEILNDVYGIYSSVDDIKLNDFPEKFVLKIANGSNRVIVCKNKSTFNLKNYIPYMKEWLKKDFYHGYREWVYKDLEPRIIAERYLEDSSGELLDYKFLCFSGVPKFIIVDIDRFDNHKRNIYNLDWKLQPFGIKYPLDKSRTIKQPENFQKMIEIATKLSEDFPHVRVDLYNLDGKIYFGELTFFHGGGFEEFTDEKYNRILGEMFILPKKNGNIK